MKQSSSQFLLLRIIGKILKWYFFVMIPLEACLLIYLHFSAVDENQVTNGDLIRLIPHIAKEILGFYPFADVVASFLAKSISLHTLTLQKILDGLLKGLITYGLVDFGKYFFNVEKDTATEDTKVKRWAKLIVIYGVWVILFSYVAGLLVDEGLSLLETAQLDQKTWTTLKLVLILLFFIISVARFSYLTRERLVFCILWVFCDKVVFAVISSVLLTLFSMWAYLELFGESGGGFRETSSYTVIGPLLFYVLSAAGADFIRKKARVYIVAKFR